MFWIALLVVFLVAWLSVDLILVAHSLSMLAILRIPAQNEGRF